MNVFRFLSGRTLFATLLVGMLLVGATTAGAKTIVQLSGIASPPITAFTTTPQILSLAVDTKFSTDVPDELPATVTKAVVLFPHGPRVNSALFPSCDPKKLQRLHGSPRACPSASRLGGGTARGTAKSFESVIEKLTVDIYNGPHGKSLLFYVHGLHPVSISGMIQAPFQHINTHRWEYKLTLPVPHNLQQIGLGINPALLDFNVKVGASVKVNGVRRGYIEVLACPPGALVPVRGEFSFLNGEHTTSDGYVACGGR